MRLLAVGGEQLFLVPRRDERDRSALLDDMESFIRGSFAGVVTGPLVVTLTTAVLT